MKLDSLQAPHCPSMVAIRRDERNYFHCFSSPKNFYGDPIFTTAPDNILSFTQICPGGKAGA